MGLQDFILDQSINHAQSNHQSSSDDSNVYSSAASFLKDRFDNKRDDDHDDLDEDDMIGAHKSLYGGGDSSYGREHDSGSLGKGAAVEALKLAAAQNRALVSYRKEPPRLDGRDPAWAGRMMSEQVFAIPFNEDIHGGHDHFVFRRSKIFIHLWKTAL